MAEPFAYHQELDLTVESLSTLGAGVARLDGWVVMVPFALPGERIRARVFRNHRNYSEADLLEVLERSPDRVTPECSLFGVCGGCQYQHLRYETQLTWKRRQVEEVLVRLGGVEGMVVAEPIPSPRPYGYRSKITPHYNRGGPDAFPIGFHRQGSRRVLVDVPTCPIATEGINQALPAERTKLRQSKRRSKKGGTLLLRESLEGVTTDNREVISEKVGNLVLQFRAGEFFQNNPFLLPTLVAYVVGQARAAGIRYLVDAYCGSGLFALAGGRHFEKVYGVEISAAAVGWASTNAAANHLNQVTFVCGRSEALFDDLAVPGQETSVIIDPPRAGCAVAFLEQLIQLAPARVIYVSCDPATQARDLRLLVAGGYQIGAIQPFDLFPQTRHLETVATLIRSHSGGTG